MVLRSAIWDVAVPAGGPHGAAQINEAPAEVLQVDPVDIKHLRRYTLGDQDLEREVLTLFINQLPSTIAALGGANDRTGLDDSGAYAQGLRPGGRRLAYRTHRRTGRTIGFHPAGPS